jgi:hypothetical protein
MRVGSHACWIEVLLLVVSLDLPTFGWAADGAPGGLDALAEAWTGVYDNLEQIVFDAGTSSGLMESGDMRVRTVVTPVALPWLGPSVLYLEEFLQDEPELPRREVLLRLEPAGSNLIRVHPLTFREPWRWRHLLGNEPRLAELSQDDLTSMSGCDLLLKREGEQFRGGTLGRACTEPGANPQQYVDYRLLIGAGQYWYRRRLLRVEDDELESEVIAYDWFELHQARLFACRVRWSARGDGTDLALLTVLTVQDQGGRARFATPDGRSFELELHSHDWPFDANRDALLLVLQELGARAQRASSWSALDADQISLELAPLEIRCGTLASQREAGGS